MYLNPSFPHYLSCGGEKTNTQIDTSVVYLLLCKYLLYINVFFILEVHLSTAF